MPIGLTINSAVNHLTNIQAVHLAPQNVTVNAILPGVFPTKMTAVGLEVYGKHLIAAQPTGESPGHVVFAACRLVTDSEPYLVVV